ncbi:hypothetical protein [Embleya sp. NBC_00896]|uniref:hypothetical protein n=1 Tax=Embleya sp. NBC_00896 TaxID=2975961 RepID=UPI002F917189|nr:hypothetical protein OG928_36310 [Embleya sp. NBC_00896]
MRISGIGIRAVGSSTPRRGSQPRPTLSAPVGTTLASSEAAMRDALDRAAMTAVDLTGSHLFVGAAWSDSEGEPAALFGRRALNHVGVDRAHAHAPAPGAADALPLLGALARALREDRTAHHGLLLVPEPWYPPMADRGRPRLAGTAAAVLAERDWPHNRLKSIVTHAPGPFTPARARIPKPRRPAPEAPPPQFFATALMERPSWLMSHPGHHRDTEDRPPASVCALVCKALRAARTPWETIDHVVLHTSDHDMNRRFRRHFHLRRDQITDLGAASHHLGSAGLVIGLKDVLERAPESGTRVLLASFGIDGNRSAGVLEV